MTPRSPRKEDRRTSLIDALVIFFLGLMTYLDVFPNQFIYDDEMDIQKNLFIRDFSHLGQIFKTCVGCGSNTASNFYRPLQNVLYAVVYKIWGLEVFGYHLLNVMLHLGNAVLIYILFRLILKNRAVAFGTALFFAVHPVQTEAVTLMNGIADPLSVFFFLIALIFYQSDEPYSFAATLGFYILSFLSKETAVVFSALFVLTDILRNRFSWGRWKKYASLFTLTVVYFGLRATVLNFTKSLNLFPNANIYTEHLSFRFYTFLASLIDYYHVLLWPARLMYDRPLTVYVSLAIPKVYISLLILLFILGAAAVSFRRQKRFFFCAAWFFIPLIPVSGIIPINGFVMEHWLYLPSVGFFFLASDGIVRGLQKASPVLKKIGSIEPLIWETAVIILLAIPLGVRTWIRNQDYRDGLTFYPLILSYNPGIARIHNNLAMALDEAGRYSEAEDEYKKAIELQKNLPQPHHNLGRLYLTEGKTSQAIDEFKKALEVDPTFNYSRVELLKIYQAMGQMDLARKEEAELQALLSKNEK